MDLATALRECSTEEAYRDTCRRIEETDSYDPHALDDLCRELRTQKGRHLRNSDVETIFSDKTHYGYYWKAPVGAKLEEISLWQGEQGKTEADLKQWKHRSVQTLFGKLKGMEVTSVVLSCVHPKDFGVISPPTLMLLQLPPMPPVQHYLTYCEELATWGGHFLAKDAVQLADRTLWVFYDAAYGHKRTAKAEAFKAAFDNDR